MQNQYITCIISDDVRGAMLGDMDAGLLQTGQKANKKLGGSKMSSKASKYTVIGTLLHGGREYGKTDSIVDAIRLSIAHKVADCECDCTLIIDNRQGKALDRWQVIDLAEQEGMSQAHYEYMIKRAR